MLATAPVLIFQDPIDRIAYDFSNHCCGVLHQIAVIRQVTDQYETDSDAMAALVQQGLSRSSDPAHLKLLCSDGPDLERCLLSMDSIKALARQAFAHNFTDEGRDESSRLFVFRQEVSFSYACKMLVPIGPPIEHFSNRPARNDVIHEELALAMNTPVFTRVRSSPPPIDLLRREAIPKATPPVEMDLMCHEVMPKAMSVYPSTEDLICNEPMPDPQTLERSSNRRKTRHTFAAAKQTLPKPQPRRRLPSCR